MTNLWRGRRPGRPGRIVRSKRDELMASLKRPDWPGRIARCVAVTLILVATGWSPARGQPEPSQVDDDLEDTVAIAVRIAGQRDTEARAAQAAAQVARQEAAEAQARAEAATERAGALEVRAGASEAERDAARAEAEALRAEAADKEAAGAALARQAEAAEDRARDAQARAAALEQRLAQQERRFYAVLAIGAALLLAVVLTAWRFAKHRRVQLGESEAARRATDERLAAAVLPAPFSCLLEGSDEDGRSVVVKVGAEQLGSPDGVVVGRNPSRAGIVLDHPEASREHFRLAATKGALSIVDLHSTNGTFVNGKEIPPGAVTTLSSGDEIRVGAAIRLTLSIDHVAP